MQEWKKDRFAVSTDPTRLDVGSIHAFLSRSYWAVGVSRDTVDRSLRGSICFGVYDGIAQVGFARVVSDLSTFAYLADVFVIDGYRGRGLAKWLVQCVLAHPELQGLRRWMLATRDAHDLYRKFGFKPIHAPELFMEIVQPKGTN